MIYKHRAEPDELKAFRFLNARMKLNENVVKNLLTIEKGYEGEQEFDKLLEHTSEECIILSDLLLENSNSIFQIDSLLIYEETIYIINIKNFEGDYFIDGEKWFRVSNKKEVSNPFLQLNRSESLMRRLLKDIGYTYPIKVFLVFINPDFILYQAPLNVPIVFFPQVKRFLEQFTFNRTKQHEKNLVLAEKLASLHIEKSPYSNLPNYSYEQLKKGIICPRCYSFINHVDRDNVVCGECGFQEGYQCAILRSIEEYRMLFPRRRIETKEIWEWCKVIPSKKTIRRILKRNFKLIGRSNSAHYIDL